MTALDVLAGLVLEDDRRWGDTAEPWQWDLARRVLDGDDVRQWWSIRPRGGRKTSDVGGLLIADLLVDAPPSSRSYVGASDEDQAAESIDVMRGLIRRTPGLAGRLRVLETRVINTANDASVTALPADESGFGKRPRLTVLDEPTNWPATRAARRFWDVTTSAARKVEGARLLVCSNAGLTEHWSAKRWEVASSSPRWWTQEIAGPLPWLSTDDVEALRENATTPSEFERLILGRWSSGEDRLVSDEDLVAALTLPGPVDPVSGVRYVVSFDLGIVNDRTVVVVAHRAGDRVVVDRVVRWQGSRSRPVDLGEVEATLLELWRAYGRARVVGDPYQAVAMMQRLRAKGLSVSGFVFSAQSVGRLAAALHRVLRDRMIDLPSDEDLADELRQVRLRTNALGVVRLDHLAGQHDDQAVALALATSELVSVPVVSAAPTAPAGRVARGAVTAIGSARDVGKLPGAVPRPGQRVRSHFQEARRMTGYTRGGRRL